MTILGTFRGGVIVPDRTDNFREGARVTVVQEEEEADEPSLAFLLKFAGTVDDLPPDMAAQHDHYIHGTPKR